MDERRIYCKFCGAKLREDSVGLRCPTKNCQWEHGLPANEDAVYQAKQRNLKSESGE